MKVNLRVPGILTTMTAAVWSALRLPEGLTLERILGSVHFAKKKLLQMNLMCVRYALRRAGRISSVKKLPTAIVREKVQKRLFLQAMMAGVQDM